MRSPARRRNALAVLAMTLMFSLGVTVAVFVARPASASSTTTTKTSTTTTSPWTTPSPSGSVPSSPGAHFFVVNATVNAASDHEIVGSSAFPNFSTGAVDNYYSLAHSHVDNSPFAQGTASPADTGPVGQTAAAGNFQQPQYADARWPGDSGKATYGSQGGPYAAAGASEYRATAEASEASIGLSSPSGFSALAVPKGFDNRLRQALAAWKVKWQDRLRLNPKPPTPKVTTPTTTVRTPVGPTATPTVTVGGLQTPPPKAQSPALPPAPVPTPTVPPAPAPAPTVPAPTVPSPSTTVPRSLTSASSGDGAWLLQSSTLATLDPKTDTLVTSGESSLGRVSLGGGQIVLKGIHVSASIANDGSTLTHKVAITVGAASIGGVPVTIDQDGVHVAGQAQGVPYQQASDALNSALKQAGIRLSIVAPEITSNSCGQPGAGTDTGTGTTTTTTTTTSSDQSGTTDATGSCGQPGMMPSTCGPTGTGTGTGTGPGTTTTTTTTSDQSGTTSPTGSCDQTGMMPTTCGPTGTGTGTGTTTTAPTPAIPATTTTTTSSDQAGTTTTTSSCAPTGMPTTTSPSSCGPTGTVAGTTTSSSDQAGATTTTGWSDPMGAPAGTASSSGETITATGLHVVFTQPVGQAGVPAQYVEHILGEVFLDSLAVPAGPLPNLDLSSAASGSFGSGSSCSNGGTPRAKTSGGAGSRGATTAGGGSATAVGGSSLGGSASSGSLAPAASTFGSTSQPTSSSTGNSLPGVLVSALRKPLWLLVAYVLWQALVIGTGASLWSWRRGGAS